MGPLEQSGGPDQEPMEPHGTSRGSRSKDNGPLELGALIKSQWGSFGYLLYPWNKMAPHINSQWAPRAREVPKSIVNEASLEDPGAP